MCASFVTQLLCPSLPGDHAPGWQGGAFSLAVGKRCPRFPSAFLADSSWLSHFCGCPESRMRHCRASLCVCVGAGSTSERCLRGSGWPSVAWPGVKPPPPVSWVLLAVVTVAGCGEAVTSAMDHRSCEEPCPGQLCRTDSTWSVGVGLCQVGRPRTQT